MKLIRSASFAAIIVGLTLQGLAATKPAAVGPITQSSSANVTLEDLCVAVIQTECEVAEPEWWYDGNLTCSSAEPPCGAYISNGDWSTIGCSGDALKWKGVADCEEPN